MTIIGRLRTVVVSLRRPERAEALSMRPVGRGHEVCYEGCGPEVIVTVMSRKWLIVLAPLFLATAADAPLVETKDLAAELARGAHPAIFYVGPNVMYRSKHIPASIYAGPGSKAEGLDLLKTAVEKLPRDRDLVIYCGCCPWDKCPNIKPALEMLKQMGFTHARAMYVPTNFKTDWIDRGFPIETGQ